MAARAYAGAAHPSPRIAPLYLLRVVIAIVASSIVSDMSVPAVAAAPLDPWRIMMDDTKAMLHSLHAFPHTFPHPDNAAAAAAAAAIHISAGLLSLKSRYSNLCTAAYGGYNGTVPAPTLAPIFSITHGCWRRHSARLLQRRYAHVAACRCKVLHFFNARSLPSLLVQLAFTPPLPPPTPCAPRWLCAKVPPPCTMPVPVTMPVGEGGRRRHPTLRGSRPLPPQQSGAEEKERVECSIALLSLPPACADVLTFTSLQDSGPICHVA
jgi:hypothetical protein